MNKNVAKRLFSAGGIRTPRWSMLPGDADDLVRRVGYPLIVKPNRQGSTVGLSLVHAPDALDEAVKLARRFDTQVMVEQFIEGRELTIGAARRRLATRASLRITHGLHAQRRPVAGLARGTAARSRLQR